jgi:ceramide glucosyltransferase
MLPFCLLLIVVCSVWTLFGAVSVGIVTGRRRAAIAGDAPPITVLKPLCGTDPSLETNLESFFSQDYPDYEILFGVDSAADPATQVADRVIARHPERAARLVVHDVKHGTNPKVRNLRGMIDHAAHDLVVVSDSNIRVPPRYLKDLAGEYGRGSRRAGLVTNLVRGEGADGVGGTLESIQLVGFCAAGIAGPSLVGEALVMGKSMLFSRRVLGELGGLECLSNVFAEDYVMGKMFQHAGYPVRVAPTVIDNVISGVTVRSFVQRQVRWSMLRCRLRPLAYVFEPVTSPLCMLPFAWVLLGPWALGWAAALLLVRDGLQWLTVSGRRGAVAAFALSPLREALALWAWVTAPFHRHIDWRGHRVRLSSGTLAYEQSPEHGPGSE